MKKLIAGLVAIMMLVGIAVGTASAEEVRLSREDAMKIALDYAGLKEDEVRFTKVQRDYDDGREVWEIEFFCNGVEYELNIDILTGRILEADRDREYGRGYDRDDDWDDWFDWD